MSRLLFILSVSAGCTYQAPTLAPCIGDCGSSGGDAVVAADRDVGDPSGDPATDPGDPHGGDAAGDPGAGDPPGPGDPGGDDRGDPGGDDPTVTWYGLDGSAIYPFGPQLPVSGGAIDDCYESDAHRSAPDATSRGISDTSGCSEVPAVAADSSGAPIVVWHEWTGNWEIFGKRLVGGSWREMNGSISDSGISSYSDADSNGTTGFPDIAVANDQALVVWHDDVDASHFQVYLRRFDLSGNAWSELGSSLSAASGGVSANGRASHRPQVAWRAPFAEVVAWEDREDPAHQQVFLKQFNGNSWTAVAGSASPDTIAPDTGDAERPRVAVDSEGRIVVVWQHVAPGVSARIYGKKTGVGRDNWVEMFGSATDDGISGAGGSATRPSLVLTTSDVPVVAWLWESVGVYEIRVALPDTAGWSQLEAAYSGTSAATAPSLAVAPNGDLVVAWEQEANGNREIFLARFDGSAWLDVDGSRTAGGVSRSDADSHEPRVLIAGGRVCVVWSEPAESDMQVVMRCHDRWW